MMINEALLLDKIKALISGYQNKGHYLYGKSDSQVASILQSYLSSYLNESKQTLSEGPISSGYSNVVWGDAMTSSKSGRPSKDWAAGIINPDLVKDISTAATKAGVKVTITHSRTGHDRYVKGKKPGEDPRYPNGVESRHYNGTGLDIAILNGLGSGGASSTNPGNKKFKEAGLKLKDALVSMGYEWNEGEKGRDRAVIFNINLGGNHYNHVHVSNRIYQGKRWSSGKTSDKKVTSKLKGVDGVTYGKENDEIQQVQSKLLGIYGISALAPDGADGIFGDNTEDLIARFQTDEGIPVTRVYDDTTKTLLDLIDSDARKSQYALANKMKTRVSTSADVGQRQEDPMQSKTAAESGFTQLPVLRYGKTGIEVKKVQQKLIDLYSDDILPNYGADGRYGGETIRAIKRFQRENPPLKDDGVVGPNTYEKLNVDPSYFQTESVMEMISNNPKFRKILIEETRRAHRLLFEYNEEQTWDSMTDEQKHDALLAVDDDMGPDIADEYTNMPWLRIPDVITNRVDLRPYMKQQPDRRSMMHVRSLIRGIKSRAQEDANAAKFVKAYLAKTMAQNVEDLTSQQVEDLMFKLHDFQASLSNFVAPTPEEQEQSSQAAYNYYKSMPGNWKGD